MKASPNSRTSPGILKPRKEKHIKETLDRMISTEQKENALKIFSEIFESQYKPIKFMLKKLVLRVTEFESFFLNPDEATLSKIRNISLGGPKVDDLLDIFQNEVFKELSNRVSIIYLKIIFKEVLYKYKQGSNI